MEGICGLSTLRLVLVCCANSNPHRLHKPAGLAQTCAHTFGTDPVKFDQFVGAELVAKKYQITREDADGFALRSHTLAAQATQAGKMTEIVPIPCMKRDGSAPNEMHSTDEGIRPKASLSGLAKLTPLLQNGVLTAGAASQICDGAAAMLICNERGLDRLGLRPRARVIGLALAAGDPAVMLEGPIAATQQVLKKAGLTMEEIDLIEVNEAFSSVPLAWAKAMTGGDLSRVNVNGGATTYYYLLFTTYYNLLSR